MQALLEQAHGRSQMLKATAAREPLDAKLAQEIKSITQLL